MSSISFGEEEDIIFSSEESGQSMPDADPYLISPMVLAVSARSRPPPQLIDFAGNNKDLQLIANNLHQLFAAHGFIKYSTESRQNLELVIRSFINDSINSSMVKDEDYAQNQTELKKVQEELFETKKDLENYKFLSKKIEKSRDDLTNESKELQDEIDTLYKDNAITINKLNATKKEYEAEIVQIKNENDQLKEKLREIIDDMKIKDYATKRNQAQFNELTNQAAQRGAHISKLEDKLNEKCKQIEEFESTIQSLKIQNQSLEDDNHKLSASLNSTKNKFADIKQKVLELSKKRSASSKSSKSDSSKDEKLHKAFISISTQFEKQNEELISMRKNHITSINIIQKQVEVIAEYERQTTYLSNAKSNNYQLSNQVNSLKTELIKAKEKISSQQEIINNIMSITGVKKEDELLMSIMRMKEYGCIENQRLINAFEDQLRFMTSIVNSDVLYGRTNIPLNEDRFFIDKIQVEIARCRQFIFENAVEADPEEIKATEAEENKIMAEEMVNKNRGSLVLLSTQVLRNEVLRKYSDVLRRDSEALQKAADAVGCHDDPYSLSEYIRAKENKTNKFITDAYQVINSKPSEEPFEGILDYLEMNNSIFRELKDILKFEGTFHEIPSKVEQIIHKNISMSRTETLPTIATTTTITNNLTDSPSLTPRSAELGDDHINSSLISIDSIHSRNSQDQIIKLEDRIQQYKKVNRKLAMKLKEAMTSVEEAKQREASHSQTLSAMSSNYSDLETKNLELIQQNKELKREMEQKNDASDQRVSKVLDQERVQHSIEVENIQSRYEILLERQKGMTAKKKERVQMLKNRLKEVISSYESAFKKQKETINFLRQQNVNQIEVPQNKSEATLEKEQMKTQISTLESEKSSLEMKIKQIQDENKRAQTIRDTFWKAQVAMVEQAAQNSAGSEKQKILTLFAEKLKCEPNVSAILEMFSSKENSIRDFSEAPLIDTKAQKQLDEWEKWSRALFSNINHGEIFTHCSKELRFVLGEMVLSSISHHVLLNRLESLRTQKIFLLTGKHLLKGSSKKNRPPQIRGLLLSTMFITRIQRHSNKVTPRLFQTSNVS